MIFFQRARWEVRGAADICSNVIQKLMCNFELDFAAISSEYNVFFTEYFAPDLAALKPLADDGL